MDLQGISEVENNLVKLSLQNKNDPYIIHANEAVKFLYEFILSIRSTKESVFFMSFLSQFQKYIVLSILSGIRRHHVQAVLDLRYATESGCWAAFAISHGELSDYADLNGNILSPKLKHTTNMYKWLEDNYKLSNDSIKRFKNQLNSISAHSNLVDAQRNFSSVDIKGMQTHFFDNSKDQHISADLWAVSNLTMGILDLFYGVNLDFKLLTLIDDFLPRMNEFAKENDKLKLQYLQMSDLA